MEDINSLIAQLETEYESQTIPFFSINKLPQNPFSLFAKWFKKATEHEDVYPNAMSLATVDSYGKPSVRMTLLKNVDRGFVFYSHYSSRKAKDLDKNSNAAILFYWPHLCRQVRVEGRVEKLSEKESDTYFEKRGRESQINSWASPQSEVIKKVDELEKKTEAFRNKFKNIPIPRPSHWGGFRLMPWYFEFWQQGTNRFHMRIAYWIEKNEWNIQRLSP